MPKHSMSHSLLQLSRSDAFRIFALFSAFYILLVWVINGGQTWWFLDLINGSNVFYGDDAYRFFLARSAWINPELYTYNFVLPGVLFLDGVVTTLTAGDLFWSRCMHALIGAGTLCLVWDCGRQIGIGRVIMLATVVILGLIPRYAFTSLSFYGEVWLGFFLCLSLSLYLRGHILFMAMAVGAMPLLRPEGLFYMVPFALAMLKQRRWTMVVLMGAPGFIYFMFLVASLDTLADYNGWRFELRRILNKLALNKGKWEILESYSPLYTAPALLGLLYRPARRILPAALGAFILVVWIQVELFVGHVTYEERYTYTVLPMVAILWAAFLAWLWERVGSGLSSTVKVGLVLVTAFFVVCTHFGQLTMFQLRAQQYGARWVAEKFLTGQWNRLFVGYSVQEVALWRSFDDVIERLLVQDHGIDRLVVFDPVLYYQLDPHAIPKHVTVGFPATNYMAFHLLLNGQVYAQHPGGKMYTYLRFGKPDFSPGEKRVLYADMMPMQGYPYVWKKAGYELYLLSYRGSLLPEVDLDAAPNVTADDVDKLYRQLNN